MTGIGTRTDPWDLQTALSAEQLQNGRITRYLDLLAGTYANDYSGNANGAEANPLVVRPSGNSSVTVQSLDTNGMADVEFRNLEITGDWAGTRDYIKATVPFGYTQLRGTRVKFINCVIHDIPQISFFSDAIDCELYGCVIYNCGVSGSDFNKIHNIYAQNNAGGTKKITNCIINHGFSQFVIHAYAESGNLLNFNISGNFINGDICLVGGSTPVQSLTLANNWIDAIMRIGYTDDVTPQDADITGNEFEQQIEIYSYADITMTGNLFRHIRPYYLFPGATDDTSLYNIDTNQYYDNDLRFTEEQTVHMGLSAWQTQTGHDLSSTQTATLSDYDAVTVQANAYDSNRAHVIVRNRANANEVTADVSAILSAGQAYRLRNGQDYFGDIQTGVVAQDGIITIDVSAGNRSVALPTDYGSALASFDPKICAFVLEAA